MDEDDHDSHDAPATARTTAPQSDYTMRDVGVGVLVAVVGLVIAFGIPIALA